MKSHPILPIHGTCRTEVAPDVLGLKIVMVNAYFVGPPGAPDRSWVLIDAGLPFSADCIAATALKRFGPNSRPAAILLTHGHFDHVGALQNLSELWDAPIYAHPLEAPYLTGRSSYPPPDPSVGGGAMPRLSSLFPRAPIDLGAGLLTLPADGTVPHLPEWQAIHTPGHTPGHVAFFRESDRLLIAGDAFITVKQESAIAIATQRAELHGPPSYFTPDWDSARTSVSALAALRPAVAATGHGHPLAGAGLADDLDQLAREFDYVARPLHGRYAHEPAVANETGVISVPPPAADPVWSGILAGALIVGFALGLSSGGDKD